MDNREISEKYAKIAHELIGEEEELSDLYMSTASIVYLSSQHKKVADGKKVFALCEKVPDRYKWGIPADFTITVFEPNIEGFTDDQLRVLIYHELLHVGIKFNNDGTETYSIKPHDLEDFKLIINKFGTDWSVVDICDKSEANWSVADV